MKARHILPLLVVSLLAPGAHADEAANKDARAQAAAFFAKKDAAWKSNNYAAVNSLTKQSVLPSFTLTLPSKKTLTLPQMMAGMKKQMATALPETTDKTTILGMNVNGTTATSLGVNSSAGPFIDTHGKFGPKGARHQFATTEHEQVKWAKQGNAWKVASVKIMNEKDTVDGKPVP